MKKEEYKDWLELAKTCPIKSGERKLFLALAVQAYRDAVGLDDKTGRIMRMLFK
jgi:hypothetical protein